MLIFTTLTLVIATVIGASAVRRVPAGQVHSVYRQGRPVRLLSAGNHVVLPLLDHIARRIDLGGQMLALGDSGDAALRGTVYWQVLDPQSADAVIDQIDTLIRQGAAQALAQVDTTDARERAALIKNALNGSLRARGLMVTRVQLVPA